MKLARTVVGLTMVAALAAGGCDDDKPTGPVDAGGDAPLGAGDVAGGTGGTSGAGGTMAGTGGTTAGTGGTTPGSDAAPPAVEAGACGIPCLATLGTDCPPAGACTEQQLLTGSNRCYANGYKMLTSLTPAGTILVTYKKADGSTCYSLEVQITNGTATWKDGAGATVATGTFNATTRMAAVMCGGQVYSDARSAAGCPALQNLPSLPGSATPAGTCTPGTCM